MLQAKLKFTDLTTMWKEGGVQMLDGTRQPLGRIPVKPMIPATSFEVKDADGIIFHLLNGH